MNYEWDIQEYDLEFIRPARTSRNVFTGKKHYILKVWHPGQGEVTGMGEAAPLALLSPDDLPDLKMHLHEAMVAINEGGHAGDIDGEHFPSVRFAVESALLDLTNGGRGIWYDSPYLHGRPIPINGLVWMNSLADMMKEAIEKVHLGYHCIKFKVGSHDFDAECRFLEAFRNSPEGRNVVIRLDANGAFTPHEALAKLNELSRFGIHSIEQPVKAGLWDDMAVLCERSRVPIALDEELIGLNPETKGDDLLKATHPAYLILKPTLHGGISTCSQWIKKAGQHGTGYWVTSALESNIGLNILAQWCGTLDPKIPQGLGTGLLYKNNFPSKSSIRSGELFYTT